jgi:hypothetical protein
MTAWLTEVSTSEAERTTQGQSPTMAPVVNLTGLRSSAEQA